MSLPTFFWLFREWIGEPSVGTHLNRVRGSIDALRHSLRPEYAVIRRVDGLRWVSLVDNGPIGDSIAKDFAVYETASTSLAPASWLLLALFAILVLAMAFGAGYFLKTPSKTKLMNPANNMDLVTARLDRLASSMEQDQNNFRAEMGRQFQALVSRIDDMSRRMDGMQDATHRLDEQIKLITDHFARAAAPPFAALTTSLPASPTPSPLPSPVVPPVASPVAPSVALPVTSPTASPLPSPVASPVAPAVALPVTSPTASPLPSPVASPVAPAVALPVAPPVTLPVDSPTASPLSSPVASPVAPPVALSVALSVAPPVAPSVALPVASSAAPAVPAPLPPVLLPPAAVPLSSRSSSPRAPPSPSVNKGKAAATTTTEPPVALTSKPDAAPASPLAAPRQDKGKGRAMLESQWATVEPAGTAGPSNAAALGRSRWATAPANAPTGPRAIQQGGARGANVKVQSSRTNRRPTQADKAAAAAAEAAKAGKAQTKWLGEGGPNANSIQWLLDDVAAHSATPQPRGVYCQACKARVFDNSPAGQLAAGCPRKKCGCKRYFVARTERAWDSQSNRRE